MAIKSRSARVVGKGVGWPGGLFGGPPLPYGRTGIFKSKLPWALEKSEATSDSGLLDPYTYEPIPGSSMDSGRLFLAPGERVRFVRKTGLTGLGGLGTEPAPTADMTIAESHRLAERNAWIRLGIATALALLLLRR